MASLFFSSVGTELAYWFSHIAQTFRGGYAGSGENGVDIAMPTGTPVYAVAGGQVVGSGYYGGGGVVSVREQPGKVWYYQHLDQNAPGLIPGASVVPGQFVGTSGGQNQGGNHPSSLNFSNFQHIEVGINAPWQGIWGGGEGPNVDPRPYLRALPAAILTAPTGYNTLSFAGVGGSTDPCGPMPTNTSDPNYISKLYQWQQCEDAQGTGPNSGLAGTGVANALGGILGFFQGIPGALAHQFLRVVKVMTGLALVLVGLLIAFLPEAGAAAVTAAGLPEFAGPVRQATRGGPGGVARGGIQALGLVPGRQRAATREAQRQRQATARAFALEQRETARRVERANATTANLRYPRGGIGRNVPAGAPAQNAPIRREGAFGFGRNAPPHKGPLLGPGGFGNYNAPAKSAKRAAPAKPAEPSLPPTQGADEQRARQESDTRGLKFHIAQTRNRRVRSIRKGFTRPSRERTARALPSQQRQASMAEAAKRKVARAVKRRRTGK